MSCRHCGQQPPAGSTFCNGCGAKLETTCARCGATPPPGSRFCNGCGATLAAEPSAAEPAGARKVVTILFGDLVGSTALHERLDAEAVRQFMEGYYAAMRGAVEAHGGRVTQVMGDGVKAVFGAPRVAEDDAIRAVRAGVEMQRAFRALAEQQRERVGATGLRVAVNTGEVIADEASEIIGDPVNVAARLQEQGRDGDVVIGGSTQRIVCSLVTLDRLGSFALKGRSEQVEAYRVVSLDPPAGAKAAPFVGRDEELLRLDAVYELAVVKPAAALAVLLGSPGLGKSRLIDEFTSRLGDGALVLKAHCDAEGGATFAPLAVALRERLGVADGASPEVVRAALEAVLPADDAERARIAGGVAALLAGSPASPEETFFVVRRLLAALARAKPVVLVIDDLHWAESLLLDLVEHLVQWGSGVALFVLVGARPELRELRSSLVTQGSIVSDVLTLAGLEADVAMRLAAGVIGAADLPAALAAKLLASSEGNPLFVAELVKMLVQEGVLHRVGERWVASAALADLEMPPTIHALLAARIERLRPEERAVLERAAVVGRHFSKSALAALLSQTADLDARLEALRRSELIERDTGWFLGEPVLRFHHVLIRDAAYRRVLKGTRAELHARLAGFLEAKVGDAAEHDETIGRHLEQAHQHLRELGPLDAAATALGERAARRLAAAGRRALARDDVSVAGSLLGRALGCLPAEAAERADLALDWCEALLSAGDVGAAAGAIDELARAGGDSPRLRAWHTCFAGQLMALTEPESLNATAAAVAAAAEELAALDDAAGEAKAHFVHAQALARLGKVGACESALDRALGAARRAGDRRRANAVLAGAPLAALWGPSPVTRASGRCLDVVRVLRITQGAPAVEAVALSCQGVLEALRGRTDAARRMLASSRKLVEELGIAHRLFEADAFAGRIEAMQGDTAAAERLLRGAYEGLRDLGLGIDAARAGALLARALLAQDRVAEAEALTHESEALAGDDLQAAIAWRGVRAEALARRDEHEAAVELAQAAVAIASATDALLDHADARMALAAALRAAGRGPEADAEERRAIELWEAKGATLLAERARRETTRVAPAPLAPAERAAVPHRARRRVHANAALRCIERHHAGIVARDVEALMRPLSARLDVIDHPTGTTYGASGVAASWTTTFEFAEMPSFGMEPGATLGDSLALVRLNENLLLVVVDERELAIGFEFFAADRLAEAIARLYERHAELLPEGPERARAAAVARTLGTMVSTPNDLDRVAAVLAPDFECIDHRHLSLWSGRGAEPYLEQMRAWRDVADDVTYDIREVLALEPEAVLTRVLNSGTDRRSGGAYERPFLAIFVTDVDGRLVRSEQFDAEREAEALARFDELASLRSLVRSKHPELRFEPLASLGDRLRLTRQWTFVGGTTGGGFDVAAFEREEILLGESDEAGRPLRTECFAGDRLNVAVARLYERYAELLPEGPERARTAAVARSIAAMASQPDTARRAAVFAPDIAMVDHRTIGTWSACGAEEVLRHFESTGQVAEEPVLRDHEVLALDAGALLVLRTHTGIARQGGGAYERRFLMLLVAGPDGSLARIEWFDSDREAEALARFDELVATAEPKRAVPRRVRANAASAAVASLAAAFPARDIAAVAAGLSDGLEATDHRWHTSYGRDGVLKSWRGMMRPQDAELHIAPIATLGERLTLDRFSYASSGGTAGSFDVGENDSVFALLVEVDSPGQIRRSELFADDHLGAAIARLYERYAELLPDGPERDRAAATARSVAVWSGPIEVDRLATAMTPSNETVDHRIFGTWSARGSEAVLRHWRLQAELTTSWVLRDHAVLALDASFLLVRRSYFGTLRSTGGAFENLLLALFVFGTDGLLTRIEVWEPEREAEALARFDELAGSSEAARREHPFANAAARADRKLFDCFNARDWAGIEALAAPDLVFDERRRMVRNSCGRDVWLEQFRILFDVPASRFTTRLLATRGERLSLHRHEFEGTVAGGGGPLALDPHLALHEVDRDGRIVAIVLFDQEDPGAAYAELDACFEAGEAASHPRVMAARLQAQRAREAFDWDALATGLAPELVCHDHRLLGWGTLHGGAAFARTHEVLFELAPDAHYRSDHLVVSEHGFLVSALLSGTRDGGPFEIPFLRVVEIDALGRICRIDLYDADRVDLARARFAELAAPGEIALARFENAASRAWRVVMDAWRARDLARFEALHPRALRYRDHRRLFQLDLDRQGFLAFTRPLLEMRTGGDSLDLVATRGEQLALMRQTLEVEDDTVGPSAIDSLVLIEVDERGAIAAYDRWDLDDLDAAYAELDARWWAGEAAERPAELAWFRDFGIALTRRDWDAAAACFAPAFVGEDHRLVGWGTLHGPAAFVATMREMNALAPDVRVRTDHLRMSHRATLLDAVWVGTREGGAFESPLMAAIELDAHGKALRCDLYDPHHLDRALARFAEMRGDDLQ